MAFWAGILVGAAFVWLAIRIGFYETWVMLFNIIISVYLAVFLRPMVAQLVPIADKTEYGSGLIMITLGIASFLILYTITCTFVTGQFTVPFPKILNTIGTGFLGFLAGLLVWSFATLLVFVTPLSENVFLKEVGFDTQLKQTNISYLCWWSNLVNKAVFSGANQRTYEQLIEEMEPATEEPALTEETDEGPQLTSPDEANEGDKEKPRKRTPRRNRPRRPPSRRNISLEEPSS